MVVQEGYQVKGKEKSGVAGSAYAKGTVNTVQFLNSMTES